jgi:hypothetical protein
MTIEERLRGYALNPLVKQKIEIFEPPEASASEAFEPAIASSPEPRKWSEAEDSIAKGEQPQDSSEADGLLPPQVFVGIQLEA